MSLIATGSSTSIPTGTRSSFLRAFIVVALLGGTNLCKADTTLFPAHVHVYEAEEDDTLQQIAADFDVDVNELLTLNHDMYKGLAADSALMEGTMIQLPGNYDPGLMRRGNHSNSTNSSNSTPTAAPTSAATAASSSAVQIRQDITFQTQRTAADFVGVVKSTYEAAYARSIGLWDSSSNAIKTGTTVSSTAARRDIVVTFIADVPASDAAAAQASAQALTPAGFSAALQSTITDLGVSGTVFVLTPTAVSAPRVTTSTTSDVSSAHPSSLIVMVASLCVGAYMFTN